jgi:hypothetical protein
MKPLWGIFCTKPVEAPLCVVKWAELVARLDSMERGLREMAQSLHGHMEREEAHMSGMLGELRSTLKSMNGG